MNAPTFWIRYDLRNLRKAQSEYWLFGGAGGAIYFKAKLPETYEPNDVISFAEQHNWHFQNKTLLTNEDFAKFLDEKGHVIRLDIDSYYDDNTDYDQIDKILEQDMSKSRTLSYITVFDRFNLWIKENCTVLSFDSGNIIGSPSHVIIKADGTEMAIYYDGSR